MKTYWEKKFIREVILASAIVIIPFTLYIHTFFGDTANGVVIFGITIENSTILSEWYIYNVLIRLINIVLLLIWFFSTPYWWRKYILIPIGLFTYQLVKVNLCVDKVYSTSDFLISLTITFVSLIILNHLDIFLRLKSANKNIKKYNALAIFKYNPISLKKIYSDFKNQTNKLNENRYKIPKRIVLQNLYHLKLIFEKNQNSSFKTMETTKPIQDYGFTFLLLLIPIIAYSFKIIPEGVQSFKFGSIIIASHGFEDVGYFVWFCALKICSVLPLIIWFITSISWWRYALLSPIIVFSYQLYSVLFETSTSLDETEYIEALPFVIVLVLVMVFLSKFIKYQSKIMDLYEGVTHEINQLLNHPDLQSELYRKSKAEFEHLKKNEDSKELASTHIGQLLNLRKQLLEHIKN